MIGSGAVSLASMKAHLQDGILISVDSSCQQIAAMRAAVTHAKLHGVTELLLITPDRLRLLQLRL